METLIDLSKYEKSGEGANGSSYNSLVDPNEMIKLYDRGFSEEMIRLELEMAKKVYDLNIPSPRPGELVTDGKRLGIRFWRIPNKKSFARAIADDPANAEKYVREFARMCKELHQVKCEPGYFPDAKEQFYGFLETDTTFNAEEKQKIANYIKAVPDSCTALHGDMHIGNAVTDGKKNYFIDLGCFSCGYPLFDLGMMYIITMINGEEFTYENFHIHADFARTLWPYFADEYFGHGANLQEVEQKVLPFVAIKSLLIGRTVGFLFPYFEDIFRKTILK